MNKHKPLSDFFPVLRWVRQYRQKMFIDDALAATIVGIMIIPQALAYALIAGMPPVAGLYASIFGLGVYALFGTSNTLSVGPVAVVSLMTAAALGKLTLAGPAEYAAAALTLALLSGIMLLVMGLLRLGAMANFLSHPVISAFISASCIVIAFSQVHYLLGVPGSGKTLPELTYSLSQTVADTNLITLLIGVAAIVFLVWARSGLGKRLEVLGVSPGLILLVSRTSPLLVIIVLALLSFVLQLDTRGVRILGNLPSGLPGLSNPLSSAGLVRDLLGSALLLSVIGFVESISVAQSLAARRRERIDLNQELVALGASNISVAFTGGFPVTGGFARSVVNFEAGAATPAAGLMTALLIAVVTLFFTPFLYWLPEVALAAIILVSVLALVDFSILRKSWHYSKADFVAVSLTLALTLLVGVEFGIAAGVLASIMIHLYKTSQPHVAVVGRVAGTEHFRNVNRHQVETFDNLLSIRIDESLYFANTRYLEELVFNLVAEKPSVEHVILMCTAVNEVDMSALGSLEKINDTLLELDIKLHLSEVKGPIMDKLATTSFFQNLSGNCYLSQNQAIEALKDQELPLSGL